MSILPTIIKELQVIADLTPGQKLQLAEDTTSARQYLTGQVDTTFTPSIGTGGGLLQSVGRYVTGADRAEVRTEFEWVIPQCLQGVTDALIASEGEEQEALAALLVKVHTGLTHLKAAHEVTTEATEAAWARAVTTIIDRFEDMAGPHIQEAQIKAKAGHYMRELQPFLSLQPGEKVQRLAETTAIRQMQQTDTTRAIHSLGNNQTLLGASLQRVARLVVGADTEQSARQFSREFQILLGEISSFMSTLEDGPVRQDLLLNLMRVRQSFLTLRETHVPDYHTELAPGDVEGIGDHDILWAHVAHGLYKLIKTTFQRELDSHTEIPQSDVAEGAVSGAGAAEPEAGSDAQLVGLLRGVNHELAPSLGGSLILPEVRIPDSYRPAFETNLRLLQLGDLDQDAEGLSPLTERKYAEAKALFERHDPRKLRGTAYNAWRQDQFANLHGFFAGLQQGLLDLRGEVTAQNVANLLMNPRYPYFAKELLAYEKLLLVVKEDVAARGKQEYPELMDTLEVVSLLKVELRKLLEQVLVTPVIAT